MAAAKKTTKKTTAKKKNTKKTAPKKTTPKKDGKPLIILESPNKVRTVSNIVGNKFNVMASAGHVMRIADKGYRNLGIDVEDGTFKISYSRIQAKTDIIRNLRLSVQDAPMVYLASDLDREGELIASNLKDLLKLKKDDYKRIVFNEITERAVLEAIENPRDIDKDLVAAAESRGVEDKVIGYLLSPLARRNVGAPSVGRVQSAALLIICERENEITNFESVKYYEIYIQILKDNKTFLAKYIGEEGSKGKLDLNNIEDVVKILEKCKLNNEYNVKDKTTRPRKVNPPLPLITTSMQTEASSKLGLTPDVTMGLAQQLFEGLNIDGVTQGLITYLRTDKPEYSEEFGKEAEKYILNNFGREYLNPPSAKKAKAKKEGAQEAHEGIRPTDLSIDPESIKAKVPNNLYRLYKLIYDRSIASYMKPKELDVTTIIVNNLEHLFRYSYGEVKFEGFTKVYEITKEDDEEEEIIDKLDINVGDVVDVKDIYHVEKETQPPKRYSEATLIKKMESEGIGRPSTYASTMKTLKDREYVEVNRRILSPTLLGMKLYNFLKDNFSEIINTSYTSNMEKDLDLIASGKVDKLEILTEFYKNITDNIDEFNKNNKSIKKEDELVGRKCPDCGEELIYKISFKGLRFIGCSNFPKCKHVEWIQNIDKSVKCPSCEDGYIVPKTFTDRRSGKKKTMYGCSIYPDCTYIMEEETYKELKEKES